MDKTYSIRVAVFYRAAQFSLFLHTLVTPNPLLAGRAALSHPLPHLHPDCAMGKTAQIKNFSFFLPMGMTLRIQK